MFKLFLKLPLYEPGFRIMFIATIIVFILVVLEILIMIELDKRMCRRS
jgi:hypothetical protein